MNDERYIGVWEALADSPHQADSLRIRSLLIRALASEVSTWDITQRQAAERLHITQPRLNDLLKGKVGKFSLDALVNMLAGADLQLEVEVKARVAA